MGLERSGVGMAEIQFSLPFSLHRFPLLLWGAIQTLTRKIGLSSKLNTYTVPSLKVKVR